MSDQNIFISPGTSAGGNPRNQVSEETKLMDAPNEALLRAWLQRNSLTESAARLLRASMRRAGVAHGDRLEVLSAEVCGASDALQRALVAELEKRTGPAGKVVAFPNGRWAGAKEEVGK